ARRFDSICGNGLFGDGHPRYDTGFVCPGTRTFRATGAREKTFEQTRGTQTKARRQEKGKERQKRQEEQEKKHAFR
ncbi:MAG TPA: hypothetical protein PLO62_15115, partial [Candidatus Hydrogenedentes bacterium]|nr:hypothetical protein [Candidatus Hydrogenedentota bacterium]